jgi:hypothetical protein
MNALLSTPRSSTTIVATCPWCDEPLAIDDAFSASAVRCAACATSIDLEPTVIPSVRSIDAAA